MKPLTLLKNIDGLTGYTTVNSLSGGKTSSYIAANYPADYDVFALIRVSDPNCKFKDEKVRLWVEDRLQTSFIGTAEDDAIVYTMLDLEQFIGREITWVSGPTFEDSRMPYTMAGGKGFYLPNITARYCTRDMKTRPIAAWRHKTIPGDVVMRFGFRANESNRANKMNDKLNQKGHSEVKIVVGKHPSGRNKWQVVDYCKPSFPLIEDSVFKDQIEAFWTGKPVRFAYMNNCVGCWWRSPVLLRHMAERHPDKMEFFAALEEASGSRFKKEVSYRDIINWSPQRQLFDSDFNECDSGYCGM